MGFKERLDGVLARGAGLVGTAAGLRESACRVGWSGRPSRSSGRGGLLTLGGLVLWGAAVRVAYWVASWIPFKWYYNSRSGEHPEVVLKEWWRGWNCGDHAVLAAALMRALGIPVKIVLGELWAYSHWAGRYWLKLCAKRTWVDIDPNGGKKRNGRWRWWYSQSNPHMGYRSADVGAQTRRSYFSFSEL